MRCPTCDSWTSVLETREGDHGTTKRRRECANGHRFSSVEISAVTYSRSRAAIMRSMATIKARVDRWKREAVIARDPRPAKVVAQEVGLHFSSVSKIKAAFRSLGASLH